MKPTCTYPDCGRRHYAKGWCSAHYGQHRSGGAMAPVSAPTQRVVPIQDRLDALTEKSEDGCWIWCGTTVKSGHGRIRAGESGGGTMPAHVAAFEVENGPVPYGMEVDHKCRVPACVRPSHLQLATKKQNGENRKGANKNNGSSGVRNVSWIQGAWNVLVHSDRVPHYGGRFESLIEAELAAIRLRKSLNMNVQEDLPTVTVDVLASSVERTAPTKLCSMEGCDRPFRAKGLCKRHYSRMLQGVSPEPRKRIVSACSASGCVKPSKSLGLCGMHHERQRKINNLDRE